MRRSILFFITLITFACQFAVARDVIMLGHELIMHSNALNEERIMSVALPENYDESKNHYPVLYVLDGETHFRHASAAVAYLSDNGYLPEMIVVALTNVDRNRDFSPVHVDNIATSGGAETFLTFISDELIPLVNKNYRTSGYDILMGHSFGGVFAVYCLLEKPGLFDAYIAVSPFLQFADEHMVHEAENKLGMAKIPTCFFMSIGEEPAYFETLNKFSSLVRDMNDPNMDFHYVTYDSEDHMSNPYPSLYYGLRYIFRDWQIPVDLAEKGLATIDNYYNKLSDKYNTRAVPPENILNNLGYASLQNNNIDHAIEIFKANVKYYPDSPNVYDSLGEAQEAKGQLILAKKNYKKAYTLGMEQNHPFKDIFKEHFENIKK
jgi:predicted alpha/beta superfamily hydrolase